MGMVQLSHRFSYTKHFVASFMIYVFRIDCDGESIFYTFISPGDAMKMNILELNFISPRSKFDGLAHNHFRSGFEMYPSAH